MLLYKYERFIHDFVGFDGCLLDPETKPKGTAKWSPRLSTSSPVLKILLQPASNSPRQVDAFKSKQQILLDELQLT